MPTGMKLAFGMEVNCDLRDRRSITLISGRTLEFLAFVRWFCPMSSEGGTSAGHNRRSYSLIQVSGPQ